MSARSRVRERGVVRVEMRDVGEVRLWLRVTVCIWVRVNVSMSMSMSMSRVSHTHLILLILFLNGGSSANGSHLHTRGEDEYTWICRCVRMDVCV